MNGRGGPPPQQQVKQPRSNEPQQVGGKRQEPPRGGRGGAPPGGPSLNQRGNPPSHVPPQQQRGNSQNQRGNQNRGNIQQTPPKNPAQNEFHQEKIQNPPGNTNKGGMHQQQGNQANGNAGTRSSEQIRPQQPANLMGRGGTGGGPRCNSNHPGGNARQGSPMEPPVTAAQQRQSNKPPSGAPSQGNQINRQNGPLNQRNPAAQPTSQNQPQKTNLQNKNAQTPPSKPHVNENLPAELHPNEMKLTPSSQPPPISPPMSPVPERKMETKNEGIRPLLEDEPPGNQAKPKLKIQSPKIAWNTATPTPPAANVSSGNRHPPENEMSEDKKPVVNPFNKISKVKQTINDKANARKSRKKITPIKEEEDTADSESTWMAKAENPTTQIFGVPLDVAVIERGNEECVICKIPLVILRCSEKIREHIAEQGVFRLSGSHGRIQYWKKRYDLGDDPDLSKEKDIHVISGVLKLYLRELPESLLTNQLLPQFEASLSLSEPQAKIMYLKHLVEKLPETNYATLQWIIILLLNIIGYSEQNLMSVENVALIFSPTLKCSVVVVQLMLEHFSTIFQRIVG